LQVNEELDKARKEVKTEAMKIKNIKGTKK
jgi:hypothetical protein